MTPFGLGEALSDCEQELKAMKLRAGGLLDTALYARREAGHRIEGEHDCLAMNCKDLGPENERLRAALSDGLLKPSAVPDVVSTFVIAYPWPAGSGAEAHRQEAIAALDALAAAGSDADLTTSEAFAQRERDRADEARNPDAEDQR